MECTWKVGDLVTPLFQFTEYTWVMYPGQITLPQMGLVYHIREIVVHVYPIATRPDCPCLLLEEIYNRKFVSLDNRQYELDWHWDSFRKVDMPDISDLIKLQKTKPTDIKEPNYVRERTPQRVE